jgi:hypothetical protein
MRQAHLGGDKLFVDYAGVSEEWLNLCECGEGRPRLREEPAGIAISSSLATLCGVAIDRSR